MRGLFVSFLFLLSLHFSLHAQAGSGGQLAVWRDSSSTSSSFTAASKSQIVFALGLLNTEQEARYSEMISAYAVNEGMNLNGSVVGSSPVTVKIIPKATGSLIVDALRDPNTVGLVIITHTFESGIETAVPLDFDRVPLPTELLSAATPALRFFSILGCHGPLAIRHFQVKYELNRLDGQQSVFYTTDKYLKASEQRDGVRNALGTLWKAIAQIDFGSSVVSVDDAVSVGVGLRILNIVDEANVESPVTRFIYVNRRIIGHVLPGVQVYSVPDRFIDSSLPCQSIEIRPADLTPKNGVAVKMFKGCVAI